MKTVAFAIAAALSLPTHAADEASPSALLSKRQACAAQKDAARRATCLDDLLTEALLHWSHDRAQLDPLKSARKESPPPEDPRDPWENLVKTALFRISNQLKDPGSAQFRSLKLYGGEDGDEPLSLCGEINGRNSYGAYVGYRRFFIEFQTGVSHMEKEDGATMATLWGDFCGRAIRADVELDPRGRAVVTRTGRR